MGRTFREWLSRNQDEKVNGDNGRRYINKVIEGFWENSMESKCLYNKDKINRSSGDD